MELTTKRLILRPLTPDELSLWKSDLPALEKSLGVTYDAEPLDTILESVIAGKEKNVRSDPENRPFRTLWWIIRKETKNVVGTFEFKAPPENGRVEIGYEIGEKYRREGFMTETLFEACRFAFRNGADEIIAEAVKTNSASRGLLKKCGFMPVSSGETVILGATPESLHTAELSLFWKRFLKAANRPENLPVAEDFCFDINEKSANDLLALVLSRKKTATSSALPAYEADGSDLPEVGGLSIVTDFDLRPYCVIETTKLTRIRFCDMTFDTCRREGEDECLETWREKHIRFFTEDAGATGYEFSDDMIVLFEDFRMIYSEA